MPSADWYFDFVSPFSYLQCEQLPSLERSLRVRYRPVLFAGLLKAYEHKGPAEIPAKRRFTYRFVVWQAKRLGIPLKFPAAHPFNPLPLLRLAIVADCDPDVIRRIFRFIWRDGRIGDLPIEWAELKAELGLADAENRIAAPEVKDALRRYTDEAIARGVFGVPTLAIGEELFWG
ncbi:MAG TPA: 2-hydroxychromene-2-carboxylate isomerase, partial [Casimicrobiaceae bacterium]|nr:2-hydroxychromene-2-carboxylate isomerase [Casimicrobiaceae bacterium]